MQNGFAIGGDYMSAASFLGIAGLIALYGYDGFLYSIGFLVAWLVALLLVAELMRNTGKFTMADVLSFRMRQRPVRTAASISTVIVSIFYLLAQMVGAGELVALLLGIGSQAAKKLVIAGVGLLMIVYVVFGGMKGTTWVQIVKAVMLMTGAAVMTIWCWPSSASTPPHCSAPRQTPPARASPSCSRVCGTARCRRHKTLLSKLDFIGPRPGARHRGVAAHPDSLLHGADSKAARKSVLWAIGLIGAFYLMTLALGFGAAALVGSKTISARTRRQHRGTPTRGGARRRRHRLGALMLAVIAAVAFATILAVVAGLTLASSSSLAHDLYSNVIKRGNVTDKQEVRVGRIAAICIGAVSIALAIPAQSLNVAFLVAIAFAIAASANLPVILFSLFWKRFNTRGRHLGDLRRADIGLVLWCSSPRWSPDHREVALPEVRLPLVPAGEPRSGVDPDRLPVRHRRDLDQQGDPLCGAVRRVVRTVADRGGGREGGGALSTA